MLRSRFAIIMVFASLKVYYEIIHDVRVIGLLQVKVTVAECVLINVS